MGLYRGSGLCHIAVLDQGTQAAVVHLNAPRGA
jgi:hypothetical protein